MTTATISNPNQERSWQSAWPILLGLCALYLPTYYSLATTIWQSEDQAHGPIVLAIALWLAWMGRAKLRDEGQIKSTVSGAIVLIIGFLIYTVGRTQDIYIFEVGSQIPVLLGVTLICYGASVAKNFWFPLLFLVFLIPLPGVVVDTLTGPLKQQVSVLAENILYLMDYPIARSGVVLSIGQYQLLVADACSGLNSMFSLSALGLFYAYLVQRSGWIHNTLLLASILPIAFFANVMRVILLVLITYYFGDEVGQGFAHEMAGLMLFMVALISFLILDGLIQMVRSWRLEHGK
ncbi:MAG: exosortase B [Nitrosomonadales bacterium]|nr:exosortase B [Nitrosomonadales bacterium]